MFCRVCSLSHLRPQIENESPNEKCTYISSYHSRYKTVLDVSLLGAQHNMNKSGFSLILIIRYYNIYMLLY